jgi:hypothetical protein
MGHLVTPEPFPAGRWAWLPVVTPEPSYTGSGSRAMGHVVTPEPFLIKRRDRPHVATPEPSLTGSGSRAMGQVATPEPFPVGWRARCHRTHGDARALPHWEWVWSRGDIR